MSGPWLEALVLADPPAVWEAIGFDVSGGVIECGGVRLELGADGEGILGWRLGPAADERPGWSSHPNGAVAVDHVVMLTGDFDATAGRLRAEGLGFTRVRTVPVTDSEGFRQGFRRLGPAILEVVETKDTPGSPERFWGLTFLASDCDLTSAALGDRLGPFRDAVQPGRRIATLRRTAGVGCAVAFITAEE